MVLLRRCCCDMAILGPSLGAGRWLRSLQRLMAFLTSWTGMLIKQSSAKKTRDVRRLGCSLGILTGTLEAGTCSFLHPLHGCSSISSCNFCLGFGMFSLMVLCISWRAPVRMNTASSVETVITGRTMLKVFIAVVLSTNCMPNILWLKEISR